MKVLRFSLDREVVEKNYSFVVETSKGEVTIYGEIVDDMPNHSMTGASMWNKKVFDSLPQPEQNDIIHAVNNKLDLLS